MSRSASTVPPFDDEVRAAIEDMQHAITGVVDAVAGADGRRLTDVAVQLGIDTKLAWKLTRMTELRDPYSAGLYVPGTSAMKILMNAAREKGVAAAAIRSLDAAHRSFVEVQRRHAGDRRMMDTLLSGLAVEEQKRLEMQARRDAFMANASLWGVRVATRMMAFVITQATGKPERVQVTSVTGLFGVHRTRPNVPWRVAQLRSTDASGARTGVGGGRPIDPSTAPGGAPVLHAHTTENAPKLIAVVRPDGFVEYRLGEGPIGRTSSFDLVLAEHYQDIGNRWHSEAEPQLSVGVHNRTPAEHLVLDMVIDRALYGRLDPIPTLVSELWGERSPAMGDDPERLPLFDSVKHLGAGLRSFRHRMIPRHAELMGRVFDDGGWDPDHFDTYRIELRYPPSPTALRMSCPLPARPDDA